MNETEKTKQQLIEENEALKAKIAEFEKSQPYSKEEKRTLLESEDKIKAQQYLNIADVILISIDSMGIVQLVNQKGCKVLGYREEEILGKNWFDNFIPGRMRQPVKEVAEKVFSGKMEAVKYYENEILTKSGAERLIAWHNSILKDENGNIIGTLSSGEDITKRKQDEEELQLSRKRFEDLVDLLPEAVFETDENFLLTYINQKALDLSGYSMVDVQNGLNGLEVLIPEDRERAVKNFTSRHKGEDPGMVEYMALKKDGSTFPILLHAGSIIDGNKFLGIRGIIIDISERKRMENELRESKELFSLFMKYSPIYTFIKEVAPTVSRVMLASENFKDMIGITGSEMNGKTMDELFPPEFARKITDDDWTVASEGKVLNLEEDLNDRHYTTMKFPIRMGGKTLLAGYTIDITERKRAEQMIALNEERLRLALKAANQGLYDLNVQTGTAIVSTEYVTMLGHDPESFEETNQKWIERLHPNDIEVTSKAYTEYVEGKRDEYKVEFRQKTKSGDWKWILSMGKVVEYGLDGKPLRMLGTHTDITLRKNTEEELKRHREHLEELVKERTAELEEKNAELEKFNNLFVGREFRIKELREKVKELEERLEKRN